MLGTLAQALTLVRAGFFPKRPSDLDRVDPGALPPGPFVPGPMSGAVMCSTERYREFIARLAAERARLNRLQNHWLPLIARPRTWAALGSIAP